MRRNFLLWTILLLTIALDILNDKEPESDKNAFKYFQDIHGGNLFCSVDLAKKAAQEFLRDIVKLQIKGTPFAVPKELKDNGDYAGMIALNPNWKYGNFINGICPGPCLKLRCHAQKDGAL